MKKLLVVIAALLLLITIAGAALFTLFIKDTARLEAMLEARLQRDVQIGSLAIEWVGRELHVVGRDLAIANPDWAQEPQLVAVTEVDVRLRLASLWQRGPVEINELVLRGARANLLAPVDQEPSWQLGAGDAEEIDTFVEGAEARPVIVIHQAEIEDSRMLYRSPQADISATLSGLLDGGEGVQLKAEGTLGDASASLQGLLSREDGNYVLAATGALQEFTLGLDVSVADPVHLTGLDLRLNTKGRLPRQAGPYEGWPVDLSLHLSGSGEHLEIEQALLQSGEIHAKGSGEIGHPVTLEGLSLSLTLAGPDLRRLWQAAGDLSGQPAAFSLNARADYADKKLNVVLREDNLGGHKVTADLALTGLPGSPAMKGQFVLSGPDTDSLFRYLGLEPVMPSEEYSVSVLLSGDTNSLELEQLTATAGESEISGSASYHKGEPALVHAQLLSKRLDVRYMFPDLKSMETEQAADPDDGEDMHQPLTQSQLEDRVIPTTPTELDWLQGVEGDIELSLQDVILRDDARSSVEVKLVIVDASVTSEKIQWNGNLSEGSARLELRDLTEGVAFSLLMDSDRLPLIWLLAGTPAGEQKSNFHIALSGEGATVADLAASLDGTLAFKGSGGKINNRGLDLLLGDVFDELFSAINPEGQQEEFTNVICHAGVLAFGDGRMELAPGVVLRSDKLDTAIGGGVNLKNERLNLVFNTRSRTGVGISASKAVTPFAKLGGNLAHPRIGVNARGVVISGGMAMATGGISILAEGMWDRWVGTSVDPCEALFDESQQAGKEIKKLFGRP